MSGHEDIGSSGEGIRRNGSYDAHHNANGSVDPIFLDLAQVATGVRMWTDEHPLFKRASQPHHFDPVNPAEEIDVDDALSCNFASITLPSGRQLDPETAKELLRRPLERGVTIDLTSSVNVAIAEIAADALVYDVDETILQDTGEQVHDGPNGRFAQGIRNVLWEKHGMDFGCDWAPYRACGGLAEREVCELMASLLRQVYRVNITGEEVQQASAVVMESHFANFMERVSLVPDVEGPIRQARLQGVKRVLCTSSSKDFVVRALEHHHIFSDFDDGVYSAEKKGRDGLYNGNPARRACDAVGVDPSAAVMFGDSMSDYGAAALAGIPVVVIRVPHEAKAEAELRSKIDDFRQKIEAAANDQQELALRRPTVVFVSGYDQVSIVKKSHEANCTIRPYTPGLERPLNVAEYLQ